MQSLIKECVASRLGFNYLVPLQCIREGKVPGGETYIFYFFFSKCIQSRLLRSCRKLFCAAPKLTLNDWRLLDLLVNQALGTYKMCTKLRYWVPIGVPRSTGRRLCQPLITSCTVRPGSDNASVIGRPASISVANRV